MNTVERVYLKKSFEFKEKRDTPHFILWTFENYWRGEPNFAVQIKEYKTEPTVNVWIECYRKKAVTWQKSLDFNPRGKIVNWYELPLEVKWALKRAGFERIPPSVLISQWLGGVHAI